MNESHADLDQYAEGKYDGDFAVAEICPRTYTCNGRLVVEIRALLGGMTLSNVDALSRDEAHRLSPQEVDPIDEEAQPSVQASSDEAGAVKAATTQRARGKRDPLVDTTPFGGEPTPEASSDADDAALFGALWPLGGDFKLDPTVDRRVLRQQRDRLDQLGYEFEPLSQRWRLAPA